MSQPIDTAYVELEARGEREAARDIKNALDDIEKDAKSISNEINKAFADVFDDISTESKKATDNIVKDIERQSSVWQRTSNFISTTVRTTVNNAKASISSFASTTTQSFTQIRNAANNVRVSITSVTDKVKAALDAIKPSTEAASRALAGLGIAGGPTGLAAILSVILLLTPAIIALGGAALDLVGIIGLIPAAGGAAAASLAALLLTFNGIGDAVKALASGDIDKINKAFAGLSPSAQSFARELNALRAPLDSLRKTVQEAFFSRFNGQLTILTNALLPTLKSGLSGISTEFARIGISLIDVFKSNENIKIFNDLFTSTANIISGLRGPITSLVDALIKSIGAGLPFLERFFKALGDGISKFATFITSSIDSGGFTKFLEDSFTTLRDLGDLLKAVGSLTGTLFGDAGDEGRSFIESITLAITKLDEFLQTAEGREELDNFVNASIALGAGIVKLVEGLVLLIGWVNALRDALSSVVGGFTTAWNAVTNFFSSLWSWVQSVGAAIGSFFTSTGALFAGIGQWFVDAYNSVVSFGGQVVAFFVALPGRIVSAAQALPGILGNFFLTLLDTAAYNIGYGLGIIVRFFMELPGRIVSGISSLISLVGNVFTNVSVTVISTVTRFIASTVAFFAGLPTRVGTAIAGLAGTVLRVFNNVRNSAMNITMQIISSVVNFFTQLPGRVARALDSLPERVLGILRGIIPSATAIGAQIIQGVGAGISNGVGAVIALAKRAASSIIDGMKDALGISSPSKLARDQVGTPIMQGVDEGVVSQIPNLIDTLNKVVRDIMPTSTSVMNNNNNAAFTIAPGAIQITVMGGATHAEARAVGNVAANELLDVIARNRLQFGVRTSSGKL